MIIDFYPHKEIKQKPNKLNEFVDEEFQNNLKKVEENFKLIRNMYALYCREEFVVIKTITKKEPL